MGKIDRKAKIMNFAQRGIEETEIYYKKNIAISQLNP